MRATKTKIKNKIEELRLQRFMWTFNREYKSMNLHKVAQIQSQIEILEDILNEDE